MVSMSQFDDKVKEIKMNFYSLTKHLYLQSYIPEPVIDDDKVRFLYAMLYKRLSNSEAKMFTISALLLQAALDVHDEVSLQPITSDSLRKNRQLTVLAGDYYVGLYYYLLAEKKHVPMIRVFSKSIQEINEYKMNLYDADDFTYEEVQLNISQIESVLMQNMADFFEQANWKDVIKDFFYLKRLLSEKVNWEKGSESPIIESILRESRSGEETLQCIDRKVEDVKDRLILSCRSLPTFESFIIDHIDGLLGKAEFQEIVSEEG
ncbi:heptaprenyl diphosphate synthase component 1 [Halalkalibacter kiskunsagensis]|uniref:Heptaprenyl diphosphate synthase component 1 n=1 Tax=Halalkalibacter kiskunsagensis TaxID=1548599 RepID=A0ABV6KAE7_9BACI